ncbi:hypothetical protein K456DRAFT_1917794 [Colletotrichum gloeosporioides 23]|nr:hypothetical protein K456DRAFT_1917794 [Colletotrichum gloeosporioides 23]
MMVKPLATLDCRTLCSLIPLWQVDCIPSALHIPLSAGICLTMFYTQYILLFSLQHPVNRGAHIVLNSILHPSTNSSQPSPSSSPRSRLPNSKTSNLKPQSTRHVVPNSPPSSPPNNLLLALSQTGLKARPACPNPAIPKAQNPAGLCPRTHLHGTPPPPHERQNSDCGCWATHKRRRHGRAFMRCWVRAGVLHRSRWWPDGEAGNRCLGTLVPGGLDLCAVLGVWRCVMSEFFGLG